MDSQFPFSESSIAGPVLCHMLFFPALFDLFPVFIKKYGFPHTKYKLMARAAAERARPAFCPGR